MTVTGPLGQLAWFWHSKDACDYWLATEGSSATAEAFDSGFNAR